MTGPEPTAAGVPRSTNRLAAALLAGAGLVDVLSGVSEVDVDPYLVVTDAGLHRLDLTGWIWLHLSAGTLVLLAALAVLTGRRWARLAGLGTAGVAVVVNLLLLPYQPLRALLVLGLYLAAVRLIVRPGPAAGRAYRARHQA